MVAHEHDRRIAVRSLCRVLCIWTAWAPAATALTQQASGSNVPTSSAVAEVALIPSAPGLTALIPSESPQHEPTLAGLIFSENAPSAPIPSQPRPSALIPSESAIVSQQSTSFEPTFSQPPLAIIPSAPAPFVPISSQAPPAPILSGLIPSATIPFGLIPSESALPWNASASITNAVVPFPLPMATQISTEQGLRPQTIPAPTPAPGDDPSGHHEIPEPNFSVTVPCRGCSPVILMSVTGFYDGPSTAADPSPAADLAGTSVAPPAVATITAGPSQIIVSNEPSGSGFVIGDPAAPTTVTLGQTVTFGNTPVVVQTSGDQTQVIVGGSNTIPLTANSPVPALSPIITAAPVLSPVVIGGQTVKANPSSQYVFDGNTLTPGGQITVDGSTISLAPSATAVVINGQTSSMAHPFDPLTIGAETITPFPTSQYVFGGQTLTPGGPAITADGSTLSLLASPTALVVNGATSTLAQPWAPLTLGAQTITANAVLPSQYVVDGQTLIPGGAAITVDGTTISLLPSATAIVVNGQTSTLSQAYGGIYTTTAAPYLTLGGHVYTANRAGYYSLAPGVTLIPGGPAVTISGTVVSLEPKGTAAVIQGSTSFMSPMTTVVTLTKGGGYGGGAAQSWASATGGGMLLPAPTGKHNAAAPIRPMTYGADGWLEGLLMLGAVGFGWLAVWL